ncbi:uncharacterized protein LOC105689712 [Athalia rosae]|uniref:uncharacterized protein LOC105689712 n=1 Tax=Athalia rosae TaxID=37344 RepID=UPI002033DC80|nr:uncharacterized protein LOC105689712 [Athalia rosae]
MTRDIPHIDDLQPLTVDEHFKILLSSGEELIDEKSTGDLTISDLPEWFDEELYRAGQQYYCSNVLGVSVASLSGLVSVLAIPSILEVLVQTKQSGTPCTAFKRYLETIFHTRVWYKADFKDKDSDWWKSLNTVRWKHSAASQRSKKAGCGGITHRDMAFTQYGFIGSILIIPETLGLTNTHRDRDGINHVWRVLGHMLGISDRLNICRKTEAETTELCKRLQIEVFGKYMREQSSQFLKMTEALLDGMWSIDVAIDKDAFLAFTYNLNDVPYQKPLGLYSLLNLKYREAALWLCGNYRFPTGHS